MTVTADQTPTSDEVFAAQPPAPAAPTQRPFTVEGLVAESNGQQTPPVQLATPTPPPTLDPQPASAPPPPAPPTPAPQPAQPETSPGTAEPESDILDPVDTDQVFGEQQPTDIGSALALLGESNVAEAEDNLIAAEPWDHETIEFMGDELHVRKPTDQALAGWSLASSRYVKMTTKNDISGLFIARHLSPATYDHVMNRLMNPDDTDYTAETIGKLMAAVVATRGDA